MSYIGATQGTSSPVLLDSITVVNGQAAYTMQKSGVNYTPASTLVMQVSLNGIIQQPGGGSYTINGSTITFASALVTGDVIDYILVREPTTGTIAPIDGSITTSKLANGAVTDAKITSMASSKLTGALPALDGSALTGVSAGKVLQVKSFELTDLFSFATNATWTDVTGLHNCSITKSDAANHVLIQISIGAWDCSSTNARRGIRLRRNGSALANGTNVGSRQSGIMAIIDHQNNRPKPVAFSYLDKTGTDTTVTYGIQARHEAGTTFINSSSTDTNASSYYRGSSNIILTEIEA